MSDQLENKTLSEFSLTLYDKDKRCYGLRLDNKIYFATLVDLPCIIEAQKTLDYNTFYKSCDAAQMLYIHNYCVEQVDKKSEDQIVEQA